MSLTANQRPQLIRSMGVHGLGHVELELMDKMDLPIPLCRDARTDPASGLNRAFRRIDPMVMWFHQLHFDVFGFK
eukprot:scaffold60525_cov33-Attheya_sp.AAC.1